VTRLIDLAVEPLEDRADSRPQVGVGRPGQADVRENRARTVGFVRILHGKLMLLQRAQQPVCRGPCHPELRGDIDHPQTLPLAQQQQHPQRMVDRGDRVTT